MREFNLLEIIECKKHKFGVHLMDNTSDLEVELFLNSFYNSFGFRTQFNRRWFDWFYLENPNGLCNNYLLLDLESNNWIGGFGFAKVNYLFQGKQKIGGCAINGFINSGYEGMGLYTELIKSGLKQESFLERIAFSYPHSKNIASQKGHLKSGWNEFLRLSFLEMELKKTKIILSKKLEIYEDIELFRKFNFVNLFINNEFSFCRSFDFLNWRFFNRPDKKYSLLAIDAGIYIGYMILGYYRTSTGKFRCHIADYQYSHQVVLLNLIEKARDTAIEKGCQVLDVLINLKSDAIQVFTENDFVLRDEGYNLMTYSEKKIELPLNCHIAYGDFDVV